MVPARSQTPLSLSNDGVMKRVKVEEGGRAFVDGFGTEGPLHHVRFI
jgi:hypothetical protein